MEEKEINVPAEVDILGTYEGTCENKTYEEGANLVLSVSSQDGAQVSGSLTLFGALDGGSDFDGTFHDAVLSFTTRQGKLTITWIGTFESGNIQGNYQVDDRRWAQTLTSFGSGRTQNGIWMCSKKRR